MPGYIEVLCQRGRAADLPVRREHVVGFGHPSVRATPGRLPPGRLLRAGLARARWCFLARRLATGLPSPGLPAGTARWHRWLRWLLRGRRRGDVGGGRRVVGVWVA